MDYAKKKTVTIQNAPNFYQSNNTILIILKFLSEMCFEILSFTKTILYADQLMQLVSQASPHLFLYFLVFFDLLIIILGSPSERNHTPSVEGHNHI